jgi:hypothetical protein
VRLPADEDGVAQPQLIECARCGDLIRLYSNVWWAPGTYVCNEHYKPVGEQQQAAAAPAAPPPAPAYPAPARKKLTAADMRALGQDDLLAVLRETDVQR